MSFPQGTYLLFDDDCGICTKFSHFIKRLLGSKVELIPMHIPQVEDLGMQHIPRSYWNSFHIVENNHWTTESRAIVALAALFPFGSFLKQVASVKPIQELLMFILRRMQQQRKIECEIDLTSA